MNLQRCRVVLRPRSPFEVFDLALLVLRALWRPVLRLFLVVGVPVWALLSLGVWWLDGSAWVWLVPLFLVPVVLGPVMQVPFTVLVGRLLFAETVPLRSVFGECMERAGALVGSSFYAGLGWVVTLCTALYGGLFVQGAMLYVTEAILLERVSVHRALRRSLLLATGGLAGTAVGAASRWGFTLWFFLLFEMAGQTLVSTVFQLGAPFGSLLSGQLTPYAIAGLVAVQPLFAVYRLMLYLDARTRSEGWDLQVTLRALGLAA